MNWNGNKAENGCYTKECVWVFCLIMEGHGYSRPLTLVVKSLTAALA